MPTAAEIEIGIAIVMDAAKPIAAPAAPDQIVVRPKVADRKAVILVEVPLVARRCEIGEMTTSAMTTGTITMTTIVPTVPTEAALHGDGRMELGTFTASAARRTSGDADPTINGRMATGHTVTDRTAAGTCPARLAVALMAPEECPGSVGRLVAPALEVARSMWRSD
jgi:hypothetical protein